MAIQKIIFQVEENTVDGDYVAQAIGYSTVGFPHSLQMNQNGEHSETIPNHGPIKAGTLHAILRNIGRHHALSGDEMLRQPGL